MRNANDPSSEIKKEAAPWSQNLPNTLHTLFQRTCEFPCLPSKPTAKAAPLAEKSKATINASSKVANAPNTLLLCPFPRAIRRDNVAYAHAVTFATTKYLTMHQKFV